MFGDRLKTARQREGVSQAKLAEHLNISQQTVAKWESKNSKTTPDPEMIVRISKFFNVSTDWILGNSQNYILAAHRKGGISELPEEAQKELDNYVEYLRAKYKK